MDEILKLSCNTVLFMVLDTRDVRTQIIKGINVFLKITFILIATSSELPFG